MRRPVALYCGGKACKEKRSNSIIQDNWSVWSGNFSKSFTLIGQVKILLLFAEDFVKLTQPLDI